MLVSRRSIDSEKKERKIAEKQKRRVKTEKTIREEIKKGSVFEIWKFWNIYRQLEHLWVKN